MTDTRLDAAAWAQVGETLDEDLARLAPLIHPADPSPEAVSLGLRASGVYRSAVWGPAEDATAVGWTTREGDDEEQDVAEDLDQALGLEDLITQACGQARAAGCCWVLVLVAGDDIQGLREPLDEGEHEIAAVHLVARHDVSIVSRQTDPLLPRYGRGEVYSVQLRTPALTAALQVHASRLIYVPGLRAVLESREIDDCWNASAAELYWPIVRDLEIAWRSTADGIYRRGAPVLHVDHALVGTGSFAEAFWTRLKTFRRMLAHTGLIVLGLTDRLEWTAPSLSGTGETVATLYVRLSAATGSPLTKLFGTVPGGLSTDDAAGQRTYDAMLERIQRQLGEVLQAIYAIARGVDPTRRVVWAPLGQPTAAERATTSLVLAQRDDILVRLGAVTDAEVRERLRGEIEAVSPVLDPAYDILPTDAVQALEDVIAPTEPDGGPPLP